MRLPRIAAAVALTAMLAGGLPGTAGSSTVPAASAHSAANVVPGYGPKTVVMTTCALPASTDDWWVPDSVLAVSGPAGGVYGYASCRTKVPGAIYFFLSRAGRSMHELTPYRGTLEAMASDGTGAVYLCYSVRTAVGTSLYITRRSAQGQYSPSALLTATLGTHEPSSVTLAAANGKWWAIWPEVIRVNPVLQSRTQVLYERRTLLGVRPRHQITFPGELVSDVWPSLGVAGSQAWLVWVRIGEIAGVRMIARAHPDGTWALSYHLDTDPWAPLHPSRIAISDGRTYIAYPPFFYLDYGTGHFTRDDLYLPFKTYLAASQSVATIAELATGDRVAQRALEVSELRAGTWSFAAWPTVDSFDGVVSAGGRATFVMHKQNVPMLYLITET